MKTVLTDQEKTKISNAVAKAESKTSGEIVPMIVLKSDEYPAAAWKIAMLFSLMTAFVSYYALPDVDPIWYLTIQIPALFLGYAFSNIEALKRYFVPSDKVAEEVHQRALQAFFRHDLHSTRDRTGILIMVSLFEHRVEIVADIGINSKVKATVWEALVGRTIQTIKDKSLAQALEMAVEQCGEILVEHFPIKPDDTNELSNHVLVEG